MTTKELIDEFVSIHAENRWMDAGDLEALLTEFAEKLKEPVSENFMYNLKLTERQARLLSLACDQFSRLIEGQNWTYQELFEAAWEKRCKEAVGHGMDKEWDGGWRAMREEAEALTKQIKKRFWGLESNTFYGIYYDKSADILYDIHRVIRHQLWEDNPKHLQSTVDAESPSSSIGDEPLAKIERIN